MNLENKKELAKKVLKVGKHRIIFNPEGLSEIKEAITKQDIQSLYKEGLITIKPAKGRKTIVRRRTRRGAGKIRRKIRNRKQVYVKITRKLRAYVKSLKEQGKIDRDLYIELRKKIKMRFFKSKAHMKEYLENEASLKFKEGTKKKEEKVKTKKTIKDTKKSGNKK